MEARKGFVWDTTEEEETPITVEQYLPHDKYHHSLKGCDCEIVIERSKIYGDSDYYNLRINKLCKTHNVMCSKTGWELGWYQGTNSHIMSKEIECASCGVSITPSSHRVLCNKCKKETADFRNFLYTNYRKLVVYNKPVSREVLEYMKIRYDEEFNPYIKLLNYNISRLFD